MPSLHRTELRGAALIGALVTLPAAAQTAAPPPEQEIVVTGRGLGELPGDRAYAIATIDRARLADNAADRLEDVLADVAGVAQFRRSDASSAHPTSQGIALRGLGGNAASRALLLLDGVPQSDPFGGWVPFPAYMPMRLAAVRVTRGGGSGVAGPGALAGTVALESGGPAELGPLQLGLDGGSRNSLDANAVAALPLGGGFATVAAQYGRSDGFVPVVAADRGPVDRAAPWEQASLALRGVSNVGAGTELQANLSGFSDRRERGTAFTDIRSLGADASVRLVHRGSSADGVWGWSALAYLQARQFESGFASVNDARTSVAPTLAQRVPAKGLGGRIEVDPPLGRAAHLRLGADLRRVEGYSREYYSYSAGVPTRIRRAGGDSATWGGFADASWESGPLTLDGGARLDRWAISGGSLIERPIGTGAPFTDSRFADRQGWEPTGRIGAAYGLGAVALRIAGYRGWRLPTLNELYRPFRAGADATAANAALDPERLWGAEAGFDWRPVSRVVLRATGYWNRLDGAIANVTEGKGPGSFPGVGFVSASGVYRVRRNLDAVESRGFEIDGQWRAGDVSLSASWAYADARVRASGAAAALDGLRPAQTPQHQGSATLAWRRGSWGASLTTRYEGMRFEDDQNQRRLGAAVTFDATLSAPLTPSLAVEARADNLFDADVAAGISGANVVERATPRTLWLGLRYRWRAATSRSNSAR